MDLLRFAQGESLQGELGYRYQNLQKHGKGGNADTFLVVATNGPNKGVPFAAKIFRRLSKPERRDSFFKEFEFLQKCNHPSIMRVFDKGVLYDQYPFLVAEYLPKTLDKVILHKRISLTLKISFTLQLLSALAYLSRESPPAIHRDIKPQNIFVKGDSCVLGDFGLMKRVDFSVDEDQLLIKKSVGVGMPYRYRTPDLVAYLTSGTPPTPKSDIFQLGLVIAEMFTGKNPLKPQADFNAPIELAPLARVRGKSSRGIDQLILQMLEKDPGRRESAESFLDLWLGFFSAAVRSHTDKQHIFS